MDIPLENLPPPNIPKKVKQQVKKNVKQQVKKQAQSQAQSQADVEKHDILKLDEYLEDKFTDEYFK